MTLDKFLELNRHEILKLSWEKTKALAGARCESELLQKGVPLFYEQLISILKRKLGANPQKDMSTAAAGHGREMLRLGFSLSHFVHAYGAMCQAITELATRKDAHITPDEFNILNGCLNIAIASAVSEFQFQSDEAKDEREIKHLGFLAHELRNALSSATVASGMIKAGMVGTGGSTAKVLELNLNRMRSLIDRSLSEVRMRADSDVYVEKFRLSELLDQIALTAKSDAEKKSQSLVCDADWKIEVEGDRQFILSAVANLVQNAIKYSKTKGSIFLRAQEIENEKIKIEVEDECGGLDPAKISTLFEPYVQASEDRSGLGLGLAIVFRAIHLSQGTIRVENKPGIGCKFAIEIPRTLKPNESKKAAVTGEAAVQPEFRKKLIKIFL